MTDMGLSVGGGRSVIECVNLPVLPLLHTLLEDLVVFPELLYILFSFHKVQVCRNFLVHHITSFSFHKHRKTPVL